MKTKYALKVGSLWLTKEGFTASSRTSAKLFDTVQEANKFYDKWNKEGGYEYSVELVEVEIREVPGKVLARMWHKKGLDDL